ncbi:MAG TPA: glycoside hydrolase family 38 C-terminal domain-containing protein [bacterium]|nr:glycoside hydrolase family 38 C-terminal domain-containing protein [bacterium]
MIRFLLPVCLFLATMPVIGGDPMPLAEGGFIAAWTVAGPLPAEVKDPGGVSRGGYSYDFLASAGGERQAVPAQGGRVEFGSGQSVSWKTALIDAVGALDFISIFEADTEKSFLAYAFYQLHSETDQEVLLRVGSNDGVRIWLNQDLVHDNHVSRGLVINEDTVLVSLKKGMNRLLAKVETLGGSWGLAVSVAGKDGKSPKGVTTSLASESGSLQDIFSVRWIPSPLVIRTPEGERQVLTAEITSGGLEDASCRISSDAWPEEKAFQLGDIPVGTHPFEFQLPVMEKEIKINLSLKSKTHSKEWKDIALEQPKQWTVYLVQHVHTDIGYTRPQTEILAEHLRYIDYALDYCDLTDDYPDDAKFRWTCEVSWAVREYLKRRPIEQVERFKRRVQEGRIEITGMFLNMAETATESSLAASLQPLREFKDEFGIEVRTAMQNDVNGAAWCLVDYFSGMGLKYLTMGINKTRSLLPFDLPTAFWWESPSGKRIMAFRAEHYHLGNVWKIHEAQIGPFRDGLMGHLQQLERKGYPFDRAYAQYSGYQTDNSPPAMKECDLIREWNETYVWPKLRSATAHEFFEWIEKEKSEELPVYRVAWPDWWTDGFGSAARETAEARRIHVDMQVNETAMALAALLGTPVSLGATERIQEVQEQLLFYDEHTFGAAESIGDPMAENTMVQWGEKSSYSWHAVKTGGLFREEAFGLIQECVPRAEVPTVVVCNTLNWTRSGLVDVFIDHEMIPLHEPSRILDAETGREVPAQRLRNRTEGSHWALWVENVPALGYKVFRIEKGGQKPKPEPPTDSHQMENQYYLLELDPTTGNIDRLFDKELGQELVDPNSEWAVGQIFHESLNDAQRQFKTDGFKRTPLKNVVIQEGTNGTIWQSIQFAGDLEGCAGVKGEYRLFDTAKRIDLHYSIRKKPITDPEAIYVAFPFQFPDGKFIYEGQGGMVTPGETQLPRSSSDWQTVQNFMALRNQTGQVVFGSDEIPLVQFGDLNLGKWQDMVQIEKPHVFSWILNNYWFTNFRATQEGELNWSYYLTSIKETDNRSAVRFGWGSRIPFLARVFPPSKNIEGTPAPSLSWIAWDAPNVILVDARPARYSDGVILHLREIEGMPSTVDLDEQKTAMRIKQADEVNVLEEVVQKKVRSVSFDPFEVKFVRLLAR